MCAKHSISSCTQRSSQGHDDLRKQSEVSILRFVSLYIGTDHTTSVTSSRSTSKSLRGRRTTTSTSSPWLPDDQRRSFYKSSLTRRSLRCSVCGISSKTRTHWRHGRTLRRDTLGCIQTIHATDSRIYWGASTCSTCLACNLLLPDISSVVHVLMLVEPVVFIT